MRAEGGVTKSEQTVVGIGLGLVALALLPTDVRLKLLEGLLDLAEVAVKQLPASEIWEEVDVSDLTVH